MKNSKSDPAGKQPNEINEIVNRRLKPASASQAPDQTEEPIAKTAIGVIRFVDPNDIIVKDDRYRKYIEVADLANSIRVNGQVVPILLRPDLTLVNGLRRMVACKSLGVQVLAHVVDLANPEAAQIEEDRCREALLPSEMYRITEALRPQFEDQARARQILGKAVDKALKAGRVDDLLADHVGISRGTLRKLRQIYQAFEEDPEKFGALVAEMERDRRIDKHYKAYKALCLPKYAGPTLSVVGFDSNWQVAMATEPEQALQAVQRLNLKEMVQENAFVVVPSSIVQLPSALTLLSKIGAKLRSSLRGAGEVGELVLFATVGKFEVAANTSFSALQAACADGTSLSQIFREHVDPESSAIIDLAKAIAES